MNAMACAMQKQQDMGRNKYTVSGNIHAISVIMILLFGSITFFACTDNNDSSDNTSDDDHETPVDDDVMDDDILDDDSSPADDDSGVDDDSVDTTDYYIYAAGKGYQPYPPTPDYSSSYCNMATFKNGQFISSYLVQIFCDMNGVWGTGLDDVTAVGRDSFNPGTSLSYSLVTHFNGESWTNETLEAFRNVELLDVWGTSSDDIWAVGWKVLWEEWDWERSAYIILHYDGTSWKRELAGSLLDEGSYLESIWASSPDDVYAVGQNRIFHFNGVIWDEMEMDENFRLLTIWGLDKDHVYLVGINTEILEPLAFQLKNGNWIMMNIEEEKATLFFDIHGTSESSLFAQAYWDDLIEMESYLKLFKYDEGIWKDIGVKHRAVEQRGLWVFSSTNIYTITSTAFLHYDGENLNLVKLPEDEDLYLPQYWEGIWGVAVKKENQP